MKKDCIFLFDIDGTLTPCSQKIDVNVFNWLMGLRDHVALGLVGGSCLSTMITQISPTVLTDFDYVFTENGNLAYSGQEVLGERSLAEFLGQKKLQNFITFTIDYLSQLGLSSNGKNFIECRTSMLRVSPISRPCTNSERDAFTSYDNEHGILQQIIRTLECKFNHYGLQCAVGGQTGVDVFPLGWDKTTCLQYLTQYKKIVFFGDRTGPGGNDFQIYNHPRVKGFTVTCPMDTIRIASQLIQNRFHKT